MMWSNKTDRTVINAAMSTTPCDSSRKKTKCFSFSLRPLILLKRGYTYNSLLICLMAFIFNKHIVYPRMSDCSFAEHLIKSLLHCKKRTSLFCFLLYNTWMSQERRLNLVTYFHMFKGKIGCFFKVICCSNCLTQVNMKYFEFVLP